MGKSKDLGVEDRAGLRKALGCGLILATVRDFLFAMMKSAESI